MTLTTEQAAAVTAAGSVAVRAGAGAGKTHMLAARYVHHLTAHGLRPLEVVAVTFTDKAATELRARIREDVRRDLPGRPDVLAELEAAPISTIHALCVRICREHPEAAQVPADFAVLDTLEGELWQLGQLDLAMDALPPPAGAPVPHGLLREALAVFLADPLAAEAALAVEPAAWAATCQAAQLEALRTFAAEPAVRAARGTLDAHAGTGPVEVMRQDALRALVALTLAAEAGEPAPAPAAHVTAPEAPSTAPEAIAPAPEAIASAHAAIATLLALNFKQRGRQADWPAGGLDAVREALKDARAAAQAAEKAGLVTYAAGEAEARMAAALPTLRQAFARVRARLAAVKRRARVLDFADLEVHALRALEDPAVVAYYHARWRAFLVDEFQDTNPTQARLLERLGAQARRTIVGDEKQAIYGFRRADLEVFRRVAADIQTAGGAEVTLGTSFRTHAALVDGINQVFRPVLAEVHRDLAAARAARPDVGPFITAEVVEAPDGALVGPCRRVEALHVARAVAAAIAAGTPVHDKATDQLRPMRPGDVAVLARTWDPLDAFAEAFAAIGVPAVHAGGGDLLATREAQDGLALLRVLANPGDSLALAAVLRGPCFAVSDRELLAFAQAKGEASWWQALKADAPPALVPACDALAELMRARRQEPPSRLLQLADRLTGYTAVLANMPGAARREADWAGFVALVRDLEGGGADADMVVKLIARLVAAEVEVPRPALEAGDAVALMTIHAAKGLEWPVVVVPDLARNAPNDARRVRLDASLGVALTLEDEAGEPLVPGLARVIKARDAARQAEEAGRLAYVALTRARDRVVLTAAAPAGGLLDVLRPGLEAAGVAIGPIAYRDEDALPPRLPEPVARPLAGRLMLGPVGPGLTDLPVTALSIYASCPLAFRFQYVDGHPGYGEGGGHAARIGTLTHLALERDLFDPAALAPFDPGLPAAAVAEAAELAQAFHQDAAYAAVRGHEGAKEKPVRLQLGKLALRGVIDRVGPGFVLDYKTDRHVEPEHHALQLWAYAQAEGRPQAHLAYLRHGRLVTLGPAELATAGERAQRAAAGIVAGAFDPTPDEARCARCAFQEVCDQRLAMSGAHEA